MRKQLWIGIMAGLLAFSGSFVSLAKSGEWKQEEDGRWTYLQEDGSLSTDCWVKSGTDWYYLDQEGYMVTDRIVSREDGQREGIYYLGEDGKIQKNVWKSRENVDDSGLSACNEDVSVLWYYFGSDGKAKTKEDKIFFITNAYGEKERYFFDSDGHMLSGWQKITNSSGEEHIYYLGTVDEGYAHIRWQYLRPDEDILTDPSLKTDYDDYEMFYFGWDGEMVCNEESSLEGNHYYFDVNGVMKKGWQPAAGLDEPGYAVNKFYDEATGARASGWLYAHDPGEDDDPHWFYCDEEDGTVYNEGGSESTGEGGLGLKKINGRTYFFDSEGHLITGLISTDGTDLGTTAFTEDEFEDLSGDIGNETRSLSAGIYYLSQNSETLGEMQKSGLLRLFDGAEEGYYYLNDTGRAYTNALVNGHLFGPDGQRIQTDGGWEARTISEDIYEDDDYYNDGTLTDEAEPLIPAGSTVIVSASGKVKKNGKVEVENTWYQVENYAASWLDE